MSDCNHCSSSNHRWFTHCCIAPFQMRPSGNFSTNCCGNCIVRTPCPVLHTVRFEANGGTPVPQAQYVRRGGRIASPTEPTLAGYTFSGWYTAPDFSGVPWDFASNIVLGNMTLYANWQVSTVNFIGTKLWDDYDNISNVRPENVTIHLLQNGVLFRQTTISATNPGTFAFNNLPKYNANGSEYLYTVDEISTSPYYQVVVEGSVITNVLLR